MSNQAAKPNSRLNIYTPNQKDWEVAALSAEIDKLPDLTVDQRSALKQRLLSQLMYLKKHYDRNRYLYYASRTVVLVSSALVTALAGISVVNPTPNTTPNTISADDWIHWAILGLGIV